MISHGLEINREGGVSLAFPSVAPALSSGLIDGQVRLSKLRGYRRKNCGGAVEFVRICRVDPLDSNTSDSRTPLSCLRFCDYLRYRGLMIFFGLGNGGMPGV
jgi:hypothetical protein